jgi:hypothetical protein
MTPRSPKVRCFDLSTEEGENAVIGFSEIPFFFPQEVLLPWRSWRTNGEAVGTGG